ncbi:hypothetical protein [Shewanella denitrificans]|uniref:hypothetical protein n=1 Tax=Shewanella denitrificans TaxID=192073 RepID=UPI00059B54C8|nr:hypothetical protein [Shewanella denitrificans]
MSPDEIKAITETIKLLSDMAASKPNEWLPVYAALGGAVAGGLVSFFPTYFLERRRERNFSKKIESCLIAEISALIEIINQRGYLCSIKKAAEELKNQPEGTTYSFVVSVPDHYSRVYQENCMHVGVIEKTMAHDIVVFHQLIDAIVQDIKPGGIVSSGATIEAFKEMDIIFSKAISIGTKLTKAHN